MEESSEARRKAELILKVRTGQLSAAEAARELGVSRKTYYKWEHRALTGMLEGLEERNGGRPAVEKDAEKEELRAKVQALERDLRCRQKSDELRRRIEGLTEKKEE
jgi:transposase